MGTRIARGRKLDLARALREKVGVEMMKAVEREGDSFIVDAALLSRAFAIPAETVRQMMRDGRITSRCEAGVGEDAGRWRLTFLHDGRNFRLTVDGTGEILKQSTFAAPRRAG